MTDDREHWGPSRMRGFYVAYWWKIQAEKIWARYFDGPMPDIKIELAPAVFPIEADTPLLIAVDQSPAIEHAIDP